jgi:hypothetical protein
MLLADRGYDADWIRALVRQHGAWANIPPKRNRTEALCFSPYLYRALERFFNKIKHCRRVATRYDKLAANYLAFVQLASIRLWLRVNESTSLNTAISLTLGRRLKSPGSGPRLHPHTHEVALGNHLLLRTVLVIGNLITIEAKHKKANG